MSGMSNSGYANTFCTSDSTLSNVSLKRTREYEEWWEDNDGCEEGGGDGFVVGGMGRVVESMVGEVGRAAAASVPEASSCILATGWSVAERVGGVLW